MISWMTPIFIAASWATGFVSLSGWRETIPWDHVIARPLGWQAQQLAHARVLHPRRRHPPLDEQEPPRWLAGLAFASLALALTALAFAALIL
jgi:hypothetical protein